MWSTFPALLCYEKYECTGQELINRSIVLINGERVALDLQRAEAETCSDSNKALQTRMGGMRHQKQDWGFMPFSLPDISLEHISGSFSPFATLNGHAVAALCDN